MNPMTLSASDPLRAAADSFVARLRRGERPTLAEYTERYPDQATRIREFFPKILAAERHVGEDQATGPFGPIEDTSHIPRSIGDYHIVREIGRGGMGIVYEAVQASLGRQVALKILPSGPCSRGPFLERFRREARAAARLHHTNIVPVFGVGEHEGIHFYAMQYIEGLGLDSVLKEIRRRRGLMPGTTDNVAKTVNLNLTRNDSVGVQAEDFELGPAALLPAGTPEDDLSEQAPIGRGKEIVELAETHGPRYYRSIARLGVQAAEALAYAHSQGVLHRDIKPSNLLLDRYGILWITDFGLAKAEGEDMTGTGDIVGTLRYMAPERFQAKSDARSDLYALGMTLYEMLALRPAFEDEDRLRLVERINRERPAPLRSLDRGVPHDLETIVLKAIQKEAHGRYASAAELSDDLRRFLSDRPIKARRATLWEEFGRWCRRNPTMAILVGIVLSLLAVTAWANVQLRSERDTAVHQREYAQRMQEFAEKSLWAEKKTAAQYVRSARKIGQRFEAMRSLAEARHIHTDPALISSALASLALPDVKKANQWERWPPGSYSIDFDEDFSRYARSDRHGAITIRHLTDDDTELAPIPADAEGGPASVRFSPGGKYLAVWRENSGELQLWGLNQNGPSRVISTPNATAVFSLGERDQLFSYARLDDQILIHQLPSGQLKGQIHVESRVKALALRPGRAEIAVASDDAVTFFDIESGEKISSVQFPDTIESIAWHPSGRKYAVAAANGTIHLVSGENVVSGQNGKTISLDGHRGGAPRLAFNHTGDLLVSCGADRMMRFWEGHTGRLLFTTPSTMTNPVFSRDDLYLGPEIDDTRVSFWEVASGNEYRTFTAQWGTSKPPMLHDGTVSPDSQWLAVATDAGVTIWDFQTGEEMATLPGGETIGCLFMRNGSLLTSGATGVFEWPIQGADNLWHIGPPKQLANWPCERLGSNRAGNVIAAATKSQGAMVLDQGRPTIRNTLMSHENATFVSVSPDGTRIATGTQGGTAVRIWDAQTNRLVRELPVAGGSVAQFSPDGRWLATHAEGTGIQLWAANNWTKGTILPAAKQSRVAFSPDGMFAAVESGQGVVRIYHTDREGLVAELEDPGQDRTDWMHFTADGGHLVTASNDSHSLHVWNLYRLRAGLASFGLDWDAPPLGRPTVSPEAASLAVTGVELLDPTPQARWIVATSSIATLNQPDDADAYCRRGAALLELGFNSLALADFAQSLHIRPDHAEASFLRGMELFRIRQWETALEDFARTAKSQAGLADTASWMRGKALLQLDRVEEMMTEVNGLISYYPNDPQLYYQRALGHAYRQNYKAALADLETALRLGPSHDPAMNNMAWLLVTGPENIRDPERAKGLVQRAKNIAPHKTTYLNTYGVTLYRLKQYQEAIKMLEQSLDAGKGQFDGYDLFFITMCQARLKQMDVAWKSYERACEWQRRTRLNPHEESELEAFRKEAETVLREDKGSATVPP